MTRPTNKRVRPAPAGWNRRRTQPMQPGSYGSAAKTIRKMADQLEARADAETPRERASRTAVIHRIASYTAHLSQRNRLRSEQ